MMFIKEFVGSDISADFGLRIVSIDTGISTGICVATFYKTYYEINYSCTIGKEYILNTLDMIFIRNFEEPILVIMERLPENKNSELVIIEQIFINYLFKIQITPLEISPSEWKPISKARGWDCLSNKTIHECDAFKMIRFFMLKNYTQDIGDWN